ncbi:MAG: hypothetical protein ABJA78_09030 [Ferruginibacter sp.]
MNDEYVTYQRFNNAENMKDFAVFLKANQIDCEQDDLSTQFDASFANNEFEKDFRIKLKKDDFEKANHLLADYYKTDLENIPPDYYLFGFTDVELMEIITKRDEWGVFDFLLARKLLKERGKEINDEQLSIIKKKRIAELAKPEKSANKWVMAGYAGAFFGALLGLIVAFSLNTKKTLPNGDKVYVYSEPDRKHGRIIMIISFVVLSAAFITRILTTRN